MLLVMILALLFGKFFEASDLVSTTSSTDVLPARFYFAQVITLYAAKRFL